MCSVKLFYVALRSPGIFWTEMDEAGLECRGAYCCRSKTVEASRELVAQSGNVGGDVDREGLDPLLPSSPWDLVNRPLSKTARQIIESYLSVKEERQFFDASQS